MQGELSGDRRSQLWASLAAASLILWLLFKPTQPHVTISAWHGDAVSAQQMALAAQPARSTALRNKQEVQATSKTDLAARLASPATNRNKQELRDMSNAIVAARPVTPTVSSIKQEPRATRNEPLASLPQPQDSPWGNPTGSTRAVMTQGYAVGTHAPATIWGGIDLALDRTGDGQADPAATWDAPVYATMRGVIELRPNSMPAGNHVWIKNKHYKVGYGHLQSFAVKSGQLVERGDLIGYIGATGYATGPHLHYHIWEDGTNVNPLKFGPLP